MSELIASWSTNKYNVSYVAENMLLLLPDLSYCSDGLLIKRFIKRTNHKRDKNLIVSLFDITSVFTGGNYKWGFYIPLNIHCPTHYRV